MESLWRFRRFKSCCEGDDKSTTVTVEELTSICGDLARKRIKTLIFKGC